jgi:hypothetical protein
VKDYPRVDLLQKELLPQQKIKKKVDQETFIKSGSNVLLDVLDTNIKLMTSLQLVK